MSNSFKQQCVMIIAGEVSGDLHGAKLVKAMRKKNSSLFFCGIGGQALKDAGVKILVDATQLSVVGITEVFSKIPGIIRGRTVARRLLKSLCPDLLILIDFPDFNLDIAALAKKLNIPVLYYISPQVWAWRRGRVNKVKKLVDHMAVIIPFEEEFYREHQVPVTYVGHPLLDTDLPGIQKTEKSENIHVIGLLPGSRDKEVKRHLPVMVKAAHILSKRIDNVKFLISLAPSIEISLMETIVKKHEGPAQFDFVPNGAEQVFKRCNLVVAASGTVTLEAAIYGVPLIIIYKISPVSYWLGRAMIRVKNIGLANLIAGKEVAPELIQGKASPENIADQVFDMSNDALRLDTIRDEILKVKGLLGGPGASERTAEIAVRMLENVKM